MQSYSRFVWTPIMAQGECSVHITNISTNFERYYSYHYMSVYKFKDVYIAYQLSFLAEFIDLFIDEWNSHTPTSVLAIL